MTFPVPGGATFLRASRLAPYADEDPAAQAGLTSGPALTGTGLTGLYAAIANRNNARVDIPIIGDSITESQGATTFGASFPQQANRAIRAAYPTTANLASGGQGFIPLEKTGENTFIWPITGNGGTGVDLGPVRRTVNASSANSWTWTAPAGTTSVRIMYFDAPQAGTFSWQIDAGATTNISNTSTSKEILSASIPITSGHVLTIAWVSGNVYLDGIVHYANDESSGITFHGCGHNGWTAGPAAFGWNQPENSGGSFNWAQTYANGFPNVAAIGIMLGVNDANAAVGNFTADQFQANLIALVSTIRTSAAALNNIPVILIVPWKANETFADPGGWPPYAIAAHAAAASMSFAHVIDLNYRMPSVISNFNGGVLYADTIHASNMGYALMAEIVAAGMAIR
jgi:lysophospholipase L1-like esterase